MLNQVEGPQSKAQLINGRMDLITFVVVSHFYFLDLGF